MIRIRYPDFSSGSRDLAGLHGSAERDAHGVTVYLLPGLTGRQRAAVIRRLRQEASRGFGPALPLPGLLIALGLDRVRAAAGTTAAIVRLHPALTLLPGAAVAVMTLFVLASAGGGLGPAQRTGADGTLVSVGEHELGRSALGSPVLGPGIDKGGSELGSGAITPVWQARPPQHDRQQRQRDRQQRQLRQLRQRHGDSLRHSQRRSRGARHAQGGRHARHGWHARRGCHRSRVAVASAHVGQPACRRSGS